MSEERQHILISYFKTPSIDLMVGLNALSLSQQTGAFICTNYAVITLHCSKKKCIKIGYILTELMVSVYHFKAEVFGQS